MKEKCGNIYNILKVPVVFMIKKLSFTGEDYQVVHQFDGWKIGMLRYSDRFSKFDRLERHMLTDEIFVLLSGEAVLYSDSEQIKMEKSVAYSVPKGEWHHVVVSKDANILIVENVETGDQNTEIKFI